MCRSKMVYQKVNKLCQYYRVLYRQETIYDKKINSFYGFRAIHKIRILQDLVSSNSVAKKHKKPSLSRKTEKHIEEKLANIENNTIKNALKSLASHIKNNNR